MKTRIRWTQGVVGALWLMGMSAGALAGPIVLLQDPLTDGSRSGGSDPTGGIWYANQVQPPTPYVSVVDDSSGIGSGNAIRNTAGGGALLATYFGMEGPSGSTAVTLQAGESISLEFDVRFAATPTDKWGGLRFGLQNSHGTRQSADGTRTNDEGYSVVMNVGNSGTSGGNNVMTYVNGGSSSYVSPAFSVPAALGTSAHSVLMTVHALNVSTIQFSLSLDGTPLMTQVTQTGANPRLFSFDEVYIGTGGISQTYLLDNVKVTYHAIPEPASVAGLVLAGTSLFSRRKLVAR